MLGTGEAVMNTWLKIVAILSAAGTVAGVFYVGRIVGELKAAAEFEASDERKTALLKRLIENQEKCRSIRINEQ